MILSAVENVLYGLEVVSATIVVSAIIAETLLSRESRRVAIGAWIMKITLLNFDKNTNILLYIFYYSFLNFPTHF